jgi:hypothetical protein
MAQAISSQTFSPMNTPTYLKPSHSYTYLHMKIEQTEHSETLAYKIQTPGKYPEESTQHSEYSESLNSRMKNVALQLKKYCAIDLAPHVTWH